ncbi:MAG: hypothetical protein GX919_02315 [Acholeplasmataceae bacterium]|nr:hypothetical protein [Acholeplasmataceae bacterium]
MPSFVNTVSSLDAQVAVIPYGNSPGKTRFSVKTVGKASSSRTYSIN